MTALPDGCIDLTVTSPPYDSLRTYNGYTFDFEPIARQLWRVTKEGGVVVWVVGDETKDGSESGTSFRQALGFMAAGFWLYDTMIYQKPHLAFPDSNRYYDGFEYMFVFSKGKPKAFNPISDRLNLSAGDKVHGTERRMDGSTDHNRSCKGNITKKSGVRFNVWTITNPGQAGMKHPAIFPEALARDHILSWSNPGDIVLDPLIGSGTTAKQAHLLGRHYLGFEISEEYCELARRRVATVEAQPFLMPVVSEVNGKPTQAKLMP